VSKYQTERQSHIILSAFEGRANYSYSAFALRAARWAKKTDECRQKNTGHSKENCWNFVTFCKPVAVAAQSKAWVCGRSLAGIEGSNTAGCFDACLLWRLCVIKYKSLRRADHSSRVVLPSVVCLWSWNLGNEEPVAYYGLKRHKRNLIWQFLCRYAAVKWSCEFNDSIICDF
jgi:hypothetical protein